LSALLVTSSIFGHVDTITTFSGSGIEESIRRVTAAALAPAVDEAIDLSSIRFDEGVEGITMPDESNKLDDNEEEEEEEDEDEEEDNDNDED